MSLRSRLLTFAAASALAPLAVAGSAAFAGLPAPLAWGLLASPLAIAGAWLVWRDSARDIDQQLSERSAELQALNGQLLASQNAAAATSLAAGAAHEMNGPLTGILGMSQILVERARKEGREELAVHIGAIEREAVRLHAIVKTLTGLADAQAREGRTRLAVDGLLEDSLAALGTRVREGRIDVTRDYAAPLEVLVEPERMREAFTQILRNALAAVASVEKPRLTLSVLPEESGRVVRIVIADNGFGIPTEALTKVFDPFFTTKTEWQGTGLGLTVALRNVQAHHGTIRITSRVGVGTSVHVVLPCAIDAHLV